MPTATRQNNVLQLDWVDENGVVTVTPRDKDRYVLKVQAAIAMLERGQEFERFDRQLQLVLRTLAVWLKDRQDVREAYLTIREGKFLFVVVTQFPEYSGAFEDELSDLDIEISQDRDIPDISLHVLSLPCAHEESVRSFLDPRFSMELLRSAAVHAQ